MRTIYFDVDNTLVLWVESKARQKRYKALPWVTIIDRAVSGKPLKYRLKKHLKHINWLKRMKSRGEFIVVWSAGGKMWAEAVVRALRLSKYVDVCLSKPDTIYDDESPVIWLPPRPRWENPIS